MCTRKTLLLVGSALTLHGFVPQYNSNSNRLALHSRIFYNDFDSFEEEQGIDKYNFASKKEEDEYIDSDSLGDWRAFRHGLNKRSSLACPENLKLLQQQNPQLAVEYEQGAWAHEVMQPEVGGLILRMPLEVEMFRNYKRSIIGQLLRRKHGEYFATRPDMDQASTWYNKAGEMIQKYLLQISSQANDAPISPNSLQEDSREMLQLYLDCQEHWQEVCLVTSRDGDKASALVLNRPMAQKLTPNLGRLILHGAYVTSNNSDRKSQVDLDRFMKAFSNECALYVGGLDEQQEPATLIHGIAGLVGATEIVPGIYQGGLAAAVEGVLQGKYKPLEFRFFVGKHEYEDHALDISVLLGKNQPVACSRVLSLKQCLGLPKPLWHEIMEYMGGDYAKISKLELEKRSDSSFEIVDYDDDDDDDDSDGEDDDEDDIDDIYYEIDIPNEIDELYKIDDEDDDLTPGLK